MGEKIQNLKLWIICQEKQMSLEIKTVRIFKDRKQQLCFQ